MQRNILEYARVVRNDFSDLSISTRDCFFQRTVAICQHNGQSVQLPRHQYFMASCKFCQCRYILCLIQREHRFLMSLLRKLFQRLITNRHRRASGQHNPGLLFQRSQFIVQPVILQIAHNFFIFLIICFGSRLQHGRELPHPFDLFFHYPNLISS